LRHGRDGDAGSGVTFRTEIARKKKGQRVMTPVLEIADTELRDYLAVNLSRIQELFSPRHLIAFGSRVNGTARPDGDLDLIVVPDAFEGIPFLERSRRFNELVPCSRTLPTSRKDS